MRSTTRPAILRAGLAAVVALAVAFGGCATLAPKLEPPSLSVTGVQLLGGSLQQQRLQLQIHVVNPNPRAIEVRGIDASMELSGQPFAAGTTDAPFTLPASGATDFALDVTVRLDAGLAMLFAGIGHRSVEYRLHGVVHLGSGLVRNIPFDQHSQLQF